MNKLAVYFRADADNQIGWGHLYRTLAVVDMLQEDFDCYLITRCPIDSLKQRISTSATLMELPPIEDQEKEARYIAQQYLCGEEIVVLDGYHFTTTYQELIRSKGTKLVCIDDVHEIHFVADAVINHNSAIQEHSYSKEAYTKLYIGFEYVLLRAAFLNEMKHPPREHTQKEVFVCMGGADPYGLYQKVVEAVVNVGCFEQIHLIIGSNIKQDAAFLEWIAAKPIPIHCYSNIDADKIIELVKRCSLAICPSSTICLEMMCLKINIVTGWFVNNQKAFSNFIHDNGLALSLQNFKESSVTMIQEAIVQGMKQNQVEQQAIYFKNDSKESIRAIFKALQ